MDRKSVRMSDELCGLQTADCYVTSFFFLLKVAKPVSAMTKTSAMAL